MQRMRSIGPCATIVAYAGHARQLSRIPTGAIHGAPDRWIERGRKTGSSAGVIAWPDVVGESKDGPGV